MKSLLLVGPAAVCGLGLSAQTVTLTALNPITATATALGVPNVASLPAGVLPVAGTVAATVAPGGTAYATTDVEWRVLTSPHVVECIVRHQAWADAPGGAASTTLSANDFVLTLTNSVAMAADLHVQRQWSPFGSPALQVMQVDIGNDGTIELDLTSVASSIVVPVTLGPTAIAVRVHEQLSILAGQSADAWMMVTVTPRAGITVTPGGVACSLGFEQVRMPTFQGDLLVGTTGPLLGGAPAVTVFGWTATPTLLPTSAPGPCVLLPTPDVVWFTPGVQSVLVSLPPAVRPATFWTQAVVLEPNGLTTTSGARIDAL